MPMSLTTTKTVLTIIAIIWAVTLVYSLILMICGKNIFKKASKGEITAFYPILNLFTVLEITDLSTFFGILFFIPGFNILILVFMSYKLGTVFNTSTGFKIGLALIPYIFYPLLAISDKQYKLTDEEYFKALDNARGESINLMTEEEIRQENMAELPEDNIEVDSIFKSDVQMMEKVAPYKAAKIDILGMQKIKDDEASSKPYNTEFVDLGSSTEQNKDTEFVELGENNKSNTENDKKDFEVVDL